MQTQSNESPKTQILQANLLGEAEVQGQIMWKKGTEEAFKLASF